jgi:hypothetical protein
MSAYTSQYPPAHNSTYVKATTRYDANHAEYMATDPAKTLTGTWDANVWLSQNTVITNQRFHIDLGAAKIIERIYYENAHSIGGFTAYGIKNFTLWGSNDAAAFADLDYSHDTGWTQISLDSSQFAQHVAADQADPKYILTIGATPFRYYAFKIADGWGGETTIGVRRLVLQSRVTAIKSINGLAKASIKSINGLAIGSVKTFNGLE